MGLSKSSRIFLLLVVDTAFFLLELIVGESSCNYPHSCRHILTILFSIRLRCTFACSGRGFFSHGMVVLSITVFFPGKFPLVRSDQNL